MIKQKVHHNIIIKYIYFSVIIDESQVNLMIVSMIFCLITSFAST